VSAHYNAHRASLSILYIGHADGTSLDRANALRRLGHRVEHFDLRQFLPPTLWIDRVIWKLGGQFLSPWILRALPGKLKNRRFDLCYVDSGELVTPGIIKLFRQHAAKIVNYNIDDPFGRRDVARFAAYRRSVPHYDLCVVVRSENVAEAERLGAKDVLRLYMSSDEVAHAPRGVTALGAERWHSDVLFLGTWFPERGPFLVDLIERGVPLTIRGANWQKAREWPILKSVFKGGQLKGDDYALALQCAKVNLGLLSKGNRDLHTTRSLEIPALGALLCAERTEEHLAMYREGEEALFWDSAEECAKLCLDVLRDDERRKRIAAAGLARSIVNGNHNESAMNAIIGRTFAKQ
jgi:spore maturation protein CgeB